VQSGSRAANLAEAQPRASACTTWRNCQIGNKMRSAVESGKQPFVLSDHDMRANTSALLDHIAQLAPLETTRQKIWASSIIGEYRT
jgi:hypothetical protein